MKRRVGVAAWVAPVAVCVVIATFAWHELRARKPPQPAAAIGGRLELAAGQVEITSAGKRVPGASGMPLPDHAQVRTGKGARALVRLVGGGSAFLGESTQLKLDGQGVALAAGRLWLDVPALPQPVTHDLGVATVTLSDAGVALERRAGHVELYVARGLAVFSAASGRREVSSGERAVFDDQLASNAALKVEPVAFWDDWTGGMADRGLATSFGQAGAGRIYAVDRFAPAGSPAHSLSVKQQSVRARLADGIAETEVDQTFWNASDRAVEGYYWFTVPERAIVTGFALETNGALIDGEVVERKEAAAQYEAAIASAQDPALLEWIDDHTYRARIYPIPAIGTRRVVLRYVEPLMLGEGRMRWVYPMAQEGSGSGEAGTIDELSLSVELGALGQNAQIATLPDARIEDGGKRVTMRRSVFTPRADFVVELTPNRTPAPLRATRFVSKGDQADFVMLRWVPDVDWGAASASAADVVVAVDVSAGSDDADRQLQASVAEAILRNLAAGDHFAVMTADVAPRVIYPDTGLAPADDAHVAQALERLASSISGGATDLGAMFDPGLSRLHGAQQPALVYVGDGRATSGELRGADVVERLRRSLEGARARFFSVGVGDTANHPLLERLAAVGGGSYFRVENDAVAVPRALQLTAAVKTPTITDLTLDVGVGLDEPLSNVAGKLARGQELLLLARTHHELPKTVSIHGRLAGAEITRSYPLVLRDGPATPQVPRLWAAEFARRQLGRAAQLDDARAKVVSLALEYGLVTPFSSILALDSDAAYSRAGIQRRHRPWDRLAAEQVVADADTDSNSSSGVGSVLGVALSPLALLSGCSSSGSAPTTADMRQEGPMVASVASAPVPPQSPRPEGAREAAQGIIGLSNDKAAGAPSASNYNAALQRDDGTVLLDTQASAEAADARMASGAGLALHGLSRGSRDMLMNPYGHVAAAPVQGARHKSGLGGLVAEMKKREPSSGASSDERTAPEAQRLSRPTAYVMLRICSDAAARPLVDREILWQRRLRSAHQMQEVLDLYDAARAACEVPTQHDQHVLLGLLPPFAQSAEAAEQLFSHFEHDGQAVALLSRHVLRRTLDPYVVAIARRESHSGGADWPRLDLELAGLSSDDARIARLRTQLLALPDDLDAQLRLMKLLLRTGKREQALPLVAQLRARGLFSPQLLRELGDIQLAAGERDAALRSYTEIVEFDSDNAAARKLVGDTLLENGWYELAYRQFHTLVEQAPGEPASEMRLALAAAGSGRTDEALRILRAVAETDVEPGPSDPRKQARLLAAAIVARLLADPATSRAQADALTRQLKQLQVLQAPGRLCLLTWDSLDQALGFGAPSADLVDAAEVGLVALSASQLSLPALMQLVRARSERMGSAPLRFKLHELVFDGSRFQVKVLAGQV